MWGLIRLAVVAAFFASLGGLVNGQDLGSGNKLFGAPKSAAAAKKPVKKAAAKPKAKSTAAPAKSDSSAVKSPAKKRSSTTKTASAESPRSKTAAKTPAPKRTTTASGTPPAKKPAASKESVGKAGNKPSGEKTIEIIPGRFKERSDPGKRGVWDTTRPGTFETARRVVPSAANGEMYEDLIDSGNAARDDRNYTAAESAYKRANALKPGDARAIYGLGNLYSDQQRWEEAEKAYRTALELDPRSATSYIALSYVLTQPIAAPNLSDRYDEAEKLARRAIQLAPSNALAFDQLGVALELRGLISDETESDYRRAISLDPGFAPPYAHLGRLLRRLGRMQESAEAYRKAIERSNDVATKVIVAEVMQSEQRYAESEGLLREAVRDDPRNAAALLMLGRALITNANYPEAEAVLRRSQSVSPNGFAPNSLMGTLFLRQGRLEMAENALLQAKRFVYPYDKGILARQLVSLGDAYKNSGDLQNAQRIYREAKTLDEQKESSPEKPTRARRG